MADQATGGAQQIAYAAICQLLNELESDLAIAEEKPSMIAIVLNTMALRIKRLRLLGDTPRPHGAETAHALLSRRWRDHMDDNGPESYAHTRGMISALFFLGHISDRECNDWIERLKRCPVEGNHEQSRRWCAYCGDIRHCRVCNGALPTTTPSSPFVLLHCCSETCGYQYADHLLWVERAEVG